MFKYLLKLDMEEDLFAEKRLDLIFHQLKISAFFNFIAASVMTYLLSDATDFDSIVSWYFVVIISTLFGQFIVVRKINALRLKGERRHHFYNAVLIGFIFFSGLLWAYCIYLFMPDTTNLETFISFSICIAVIAGGVPGFAISLKGSLAFLFPIAIAFSLKFYELQFYTLCLVSIFFELYLVLNTIRLNKVLAHSIRGDIENEKLIERVTVEKESAEKANLEKSQFLAAASHDLRQPLNSMALFLYALKERVKNCDEEKIVKLTSQIEDSFLALKKLFDSLLEISHLDAGTLNAVRKKVKTKRIKPVYRSKPAKGTHVLIIDDEPGMLKGMSLLLTDWGCVVTTAENHQQAMSSITKKIPDIILSDYRLQENITGLEVVNDLRNALNQDVPAIIITGDTDTAGLQKIQDAGYFMLSKPVNPEELQDKIGVLTND